jgi:hypothetical protein
LKIGIFTVGNFFTAMNLNAYAKHKGVTRFTVMRAIKLGMPVASEQKGRRTFYDVDCDSADVWWAANMREPEPKADNVHELRGKARREEYLAEREKIRLQRDREQVLDKREVADAVKAQLTSLRQGFLAMPDKIAKRLGLGRKERAIVEELVSAELHQAAERLSVLDVYERDIA